MKQSSLYPTLGNLKVFVACLLVFAIFITPISAVTASSIARATLPGEDADGITAPIRQIRQIRSQQPKNCSSIRQCAPARPATETGAVLPGPKPEPAPEPLAPPVPGPVTATMTAALTATANNGDGKADPGDTINYTVTPRQHQRLGRDRSFLQPDARLAHNFCARLNQEHAHLF